MTSTGKTISAENRVAILELYARLAWALDGGDTETFVGLFTPDGVAFGSRGHDAMRAWHRRFVRDASYAGSQHFTSQFRFIPEDDSRVVVRTYVARLHRVPGTTAASPIELGYDTDVVVKRGARWLFEWKTRHFAEDLIAGELGTVQSTRRPNEPAAALHDLGTEG